MSNNTSRFSISWLRTLNPFSRWTTPNGRASSQFGLSDGPRLYTTEELAKATRNFSSDSLLGEGGYGDVYRAVFSSGTQAAVKVIKNEAALHQRSFAAELATLGNLSHQNLVQLKGWCFTQTELFLVYDYMPNKSLDTHLFRPLNEDEDTDRDQCILPWSIRCHIIRGIAQGLLYLHDAAQVVHRDIKAANVLLDSNFNAHISDFGLARHMFTSCNNNNVLPGYSSIFHDVTLGDGSPGYTAPECIGTRAQPAPMSDVFSFGVVVFEILSARKATFSSGLLLVDWIHTLASWDLLLDACDLKFRASVHAQRREILGLFNLGLQCTQIEAADRPTMNQVLCLLNDLPSIPPPKSLDSSRRYRDIVNNSMLDIATLSSSFLEEERRQLNLEECSSLVRAPRAFPWAIIDVATRQFRNRISYGAYSETYCGEAFGQQVAVKVSKDCRLGKKLLKTELQSFRNVRHINILTPIGWSSDPWGSRCALVYDYMANGSLQDWLGKEERGLPWNLCFRIAKELGAALLHLHKNCNSVAMVHKNVKPGNVLLDSEFHVRLADPGLPINNDSEPHMTGYLDPEYKRTGKVTEYVDVYAYGVVILQLVTGRDHDYHLSNESERAQFLATKVVPVDIKLKETNDPLQVEGYDASQVEGLFRLGLSCSRNLSKDRPDMKRVMQDILEYEQPSDCLHSPPVDVHTSTWFVGNPASISVLCVR